MKLRRPLGPSRDDLVTAIDRYLAEARDLERDLALARALAGYRALDRARARDLARALDNARARARALARDLALDRALALDLARDLDNARALARALDLARDLDNARALDLARDLDLDLDRALARDLVQELERVRSAAAEGEEPVSAGAGADRVARCPAGVALRVNRLAVRGLSPAARALYGEELLDEVYDLADQHATRRAQVACAVRQLARVRQLRVTARAASTARTTTSSASGE